MLSLSLIAIHSLPPTTWDSHFDEVTRPYNSCNGCGNWFCYRSSWKCSGVSLCSS
ncbi:hypothetical protein RchiOBHm_Chr5g0022651 [Rosa chinensis]|uniref:Uncharacterized protein n=1 Tax=Rosa chinensis TaxID=74649 RepID=A0A2P6Q7U8_ROSCH|nr:hypothetical protein RchiOBHm_Chr5g0022651 [Rosa chinensis]